MTRLRLALATLVVAAAAVVASQTVTGATPAPEPTAAPKAAEPPQYTARLVRAYDTFDANQGVAVDSESFYAIDNTHITQHRRSDGRPLRQFSGGDDGPLIHMDSGAVHSGRLFAAHSNYDQFPMESSVETYDARTLRHVDSHSFGVDRGSLTWIDRHDGEWWGGFANYDKVPDGQTKPYGGTDNTQVVRLDNRFQVTQGYTIPQEILNRFKPMSNSGGSWGPDGRLWLTGHDLDEAYVMEPPKAGSELRWIATVKLPGVEGQAIAWDLTGRRPTLWAIKRSTKQVLQFDVPWRQIAEPDSTVGHVNGPGEFER